MKIKQILVAFLFATLVIGFVGCQNSTRSKITGIWESSYTNDDITMSSTTMFSEGKNKSFITKGNIVTSNGYNCKFSTNGNFRITENNILSLMYGNVSIYKCNSNYVESKVRAILGKLKHLTFSHRILSLDSEIMITEDMDTYKKTTYMKNPYLTKQQESGELKFFDHSFLKR
jgi:hypothetical protein